MSSSKKSPKQQKMPDPKELIALQAEYNRVNVDTPFGSQTYTPGADGRSTTLKTDIGPEGQQLVGRGVGLGMTDSNRMSVDPRMNQLAGGLLEKVGKRFGMDLGGSLQLAPEANMPQAKPQQQVQPTPGPTTAMPVGPGTGFGAPAGGIPRVGGGSGGFSPSMVSPSQLNDFTEAFRQQGLGGRR